MAVKFNFGVISTLVTEYTYTEDGRFETEVEKFMIGASTEKGYQYVLAIDPFATSFDASKFLDTLNHNPNTNPDRWMSDYPIYGSEAWDSEAEYELACFEADSYGEQRPMWF